MLGLAPDKRGLLPESDVARLKEFGAEIRRIYGADGGGDGDGPEESWSSSAPLEIAAAEPMTFDRAVAMERLSGGQRVLRYAIEAWDGARWRPLGTRLHDRPQENRYLSAHHGPPRSAAYRRRFRGAAHPQVPVVRWGRALTTLTPFRCIMVQ